MSRISYLGMGAMGSRMAMNLIKAGHEVTVWNRHESKTAPLVEAGAAKAATPAEAADGAEFVIACVRDDEASRRIWLDPGSGALAAMDATAVAVESSTLTVDWARELAGHCRSKGIAFLDAPVAGTLPHAEAAKLIYLVGGEADVLEKARSVLSVMGGTIHHVGPSGAGAAIKLMVNSLLGAQVALFAELIGMMKHLGVDAEHAVEIVTSSPVCSTAAKTYAEAMIAGKFEPMFAIEMAEKDFRYIVDSAGDAEDVPISDATRLVFHRAVESGFGELNMNGVVKLYK